MPYRTAAAIALAASPALATVRYVDRTAPAGGDGLSWAASYNDLQLALAAAAAGDEIRIAHGTYKPGPPTAPRTATFLISPGVTLRGGFAGRGAPDPDFRDLVGLATVLHGDLAGDDGPNYTNTFENAFHVVSVTAGDASTVLDGLTITHGHATWTAPDDRGGGLVIQNASPTVIDCTFTLNDSDHGAGIRITGGAPHISRCTLTANRGQSDGGGVSVYGQSGAVFTDCVFRGNIGGWGAGAFNTGGSTARYERCTFRDNLGQIGTGDGPGMADVGASSVVVGCVFAGGITDSGGGGIFCSAANTLVLNTAFIGNQGIADGGGAVYITAGHPVFAGCLFTGNTSSLAGGNVMFLSGTSVADLINCTVVNNGNGVGSGAFQAASGALRCWNTVFWNNRDHAGSGVASLFAGGTPQAARCSIQGWAGSPAGPGNSGADPLFIDLDGPDNTPGNDDDNPRLSAGSPAIDSADNTVIPAAITTDLDGLPRFADDPATPDTGIPGGPGGPLIADRGAYEFHPPAPPCYPNCDGSTAPPILNVNDFQCFLNRYAANDPYANCDGSSIPPVLNVNDFACFLNRYAQGCP